MSRRRVYTTLEEKIEANRVKARERYRKLKAAGFFINKEKKRKGRAKENYRVDRSDCEIQRGVNCCSECCRFAYCNGLAKHPYTEKAIDLFLNTRKE